MNGEVPNGCEAEGHLANQKPSKPRASKKMKPRHLPLIASLLLISCATGPTELVDDQTDDASCFRVATCVEQGQEAMEQGRIDEAVPYLTEACRRGAAEACRMLAAGHAVGSIGERDIDTAEALYRWGCFDAGDALSCHGLGELVRLELVDDDEGDGGAAYFERACDLGAGEGCHDEAVVAVEQEQPDEETEQWAVEVFQRACDEGLAAGCVNLGYMTAAGRGIGRDHGEAAKVFHDACEGGDEGWSAHPLAGLSRDADPDAFAVAEFRPEVACEQLEVLLVGGYEERIISAVDAETEALRECYDDARPDGESRVGRLTIRAGVTAAGDGVSPEIVDDELRLDDVAECVQQMLDRHLDDRADDEAVYETQWGISFVHPPKLDGAERVDWQLEGCDARAVQREVGEIFEELQECGARHMERHPDDPGAVVAMWTMEPTGEVGEIAMESTVQRRGIHSCLEETIQTVAIPEFDGDACPVQVPFLFSDGTRLHFSVVGR